MAYRKAFDEVFIKGTIQTVAKLGIEKTRTKFIAEHAGFSEATMYKMFPSKEDLLRDTFLYLDKKIADMLRQGTNARNSCNEPSKSGLYAIWYRIYRYLLNHKEEALFMIRYRYSSLYTEEVSEMRKEYEGSYDKVYDLLDEQLGEIDEEVKNFLLNYAFEVTLCFVEKILSGKLEDDKEIESYIWLTVSNTARSWLLVREASNTQE